MKLAITSLDISVIVTDNVFGKLSNGSLIFYVLLRYHFK